LPEKIKDFSGSYTPAPLSLLLERGAGVSDSYAPFGCGSYIGLAGLGLTLGLLLTPRKLAGGVREGVTDPYPASLGHKKNQRFFMASKLPSPPRGVQGDRAKPGGQGRFLFFELLEKNKTPTPFSGGRITLL